MDDPLTRTALDRIRRLVEVLQQHDVDVDDIVLVAVAGIVVAIEARAYSGPLVVHEVPGAGPRAEWALKWTESYLVLSLLLPSSAPRLDGDPDDVPGAVPVLVIQGGEVEVTFVMHEDLEHQVPS